jgi:hypothetical protein
VHPRRAARVAVSLTARTRSTTTRVSNAQRIAHENFWWCKKLDVIRTFCNNGILLLASRNELFVCARVKFCIDSARAFDICTGKNNFQNLPRKQRARTGIEQKMSESVPSDSHRARPPAAKFSDPSRCSKQFRVEFQISALQRGARLPHCTQNGRRHARTVARVRFRVSFSGFR